jgi:phosphomannomutase/phosphoglucomutase
MTMMDPDKVFGSDEIDLRGERIDPDLFRRVGENIVLRVRETGVPSPQVLLGGDTRYDTLTLMEFLSRGIFNRGGSIILIGGDIAKPVAYFAAQRYRADVVAYVTASHVRASFNGVKIHFLDKAAHQQPVLPLAAKEVVNKREEALNDYQQYLATRFGSDTGKGRPLVMDSLYSSSWTVAPHVFRRARFNLECIHTYIDRKFSCLQNNAPDPTLPRNLNELRVVVRGWEGVGVAFDGDMDRAAFVDENGEVVHADEIAMIIASHILAKAKRRARVVYHCQCSNGLPETIEKAKGTPVIQETGWRSIKSKMGEVGAVFGSEISGHFFYGNDLYYVRNGDDALYTTLMLFRALDQRRQTLAEARAELPAYFASPELRVDYDGARNARIVEVLRDRFEKDGDYSLATIGNDLRAEKYDGKEWCSWLVFRTSRTEPTKLSFRFEGRTLRHLAEVKRALLESIPEADKPLRGMLEKAYRTSVGDPTAYYRRALEAAGKLP